MKGGGGLTRGEGLNDIKSMPQLDFPEAIPQSVQSGY
jgi:hypothetical protein